MNRAAEVVLVAALAMQGTSLAEEIDHIVVGVNYFLRGFLMDDKVQVLHVDRLRNKVQVLKLDANEIEWVAPSAIISRRESNERDAGRVIAAITAITALSKPSTVPQTPVWTSGAPHPTHANVVASNEQGKWQPATGYEWVDMGRSWQVAWRANLPHPSHSNVLSSDEPGKWQAAPGYRLNNRDRGFGATWVPGVQHPRYSKVVSSPKEGEWQPAPGYHWDNTKGTFGVVWTPGIRHSNQYPKLVSAQGIDAWLPAPGYGWLDRERFTVQWLPGALYPGRGNVVASRDEGLWHINGAIGIDFNIGSEFPQIARVYKGSPAESSGLMPGMLIASLDGVSTRNASLDGVMQRMGGRNGTRLDVEIMDGQTGRKQVYRVVRQSFLARY